MLTTEQINELRATAHRQMKFQEMLEDGEDLHDALRGRNIPLNQEDITLLLETIQAQIRRLMSEHNRPLRGYGTAKESRNKRMAKEKADRLNELISHICEYAD